MNRVVRARGLTVVTGGATLLADIDLELAPREHLAVLGPNGAGKTTLLRVLATYRFPTSGAVEVLGERFGRVDLRALRPRVGLVSVGLDPLLANHARVASLVAAARTGALVGWHAPVGDEGVVERVTAALTRVGADHLTDRRLDTLSQGEQQRVRIARALVTDPELLLLDEPFAGLDLGGREALLADLDGLLAEPDGPTVVLVTHHLEELPTGTVRALLLREGRTVAEGGVDGVLVSSAVSEAFGLDVEVITERGRFAARLNSGSTGR
jgi:iron complex transport system ATP-binding protein